MLGWWSRVGQDLALQKCLWCIHWASGEKSWLSGAYQARCVEERSFSKVNRFEGGHHSNTMARRTISPRVCTTLNHTSAYCDTISSPSEHGVSNMLTTYGPQPAVWTHIMACDYTYTHEGTHTHAHTYLHTQARTHTQTHTRTHTHTHTHKFEGSLLHLNTS